MKTYTSIVLLSCLWLASCTTKEKTQQEDTVTNKETSLKDYANKEGKVIWKRDNKFIKNFFGQYPRVLISNLYYPTTNGIKSILKEEGKDILLSGTMRKLGSIPQDNHLLFVLDDVNEYESGRNGYRYLFSMGANTLTLLQIVEVKQNQTNCGFLEGNNEYFELDSTTTGGPYLVSVIERTAVKDMAEDGCATKSPVSGRYYYTLKNNQLALQSFCPINGNTMNLSKLYALSKSDFNNLTYAAIDQYNFFNISRMLQACGKDEYRGITHLEKLAGIMLAGGQAKKRTDLMPFIEEEFMNVNPAFISWGRKHLIPSPTEKQQNGLTFQFIYDVAYKKWLRALALQKLVISSSNIDSLLTDYIANTAVTTIDAAGNKQRVDYNPKAYEYLESKHKWMMEQINAKDKYNLGINDYGFWMRRMLDGSEPEIWKTLKYILKMYDGEWFENAMLARAIEIDSISYQLAMNNKDGLRLNNKKDIPADIVIDTLNGVKITARNGKTVTYENNNSDGESSASYNIIGYWKNREMIVVDYSGWEWGGTNLVDINTGETESLSWGIQIAKGDKRMAEIDEGYEEISISLSHYEDSKWVSYYSVNNEAMVNNISNGFWVGDDYYFEKTTYKTNASRYYKVGTFGFDDIQPHTAPLPTNLIKTDPIPADAEGVE